MTASFAVTLISFDKDLIASMRGSLTDEDAFVIPRHMRLALSPDEAISTIFTEEEPISRPTLFLSFG